MATAPARSRHQRSRRLTTALLALLLFVPATYVVIDPYLDAASVLLRVSDPKRNDLLTRHHANAVETRNTQFSTPSGLVRARLYIPIGIEDPPAMIVLHGVHHLGIDEPRLVSFSRALSTHGVLVMTPELRDLADYHVEMNSIEVIGAAIRDLKARTGADHVAVLGLSFAGGLALVAAADPRYENDISTVISIGGHDSLARVLRFFASNSVETPSGPLPMAAHEYGVLVVAFAHPEEFFSTKDAPLAREAIRQQLFENLAEAQSIANRLSPAGRARMGLLLAHKTSELSSDLLRGLANHEAEAATVSPAGKLGNLRATVLLAHGAGDNVIPPAELLWLQREIPPGKLKLALISPAISHVELGGKPTFADEWRLVHFMEELLHEVNQQARSRHALVSSQPEFAPVAPQSQ